MAGWVLSEGVRECERKKRAKNLQRLICPEVATHITLLETFQCSKPSRRERDILEKDIIREPNVKLRSPSFNSAAGDVGPTSTPGVTGSLDTHNGDVRYIYPAHMQHLHIMPLIVYKAKPTLTLCIREWQSYYGEASALVHDS